MGEHTQAPAQVQKEALPRWIQRQVWLALTAANTLWLAPDSSRSLQAHLSLAPWLKAVSLAEVTWTELDHAKDAWSPAREPERQNSQVRRGPGSMSAVRCRQQESAVRWKHAP